MTLGQIMTLALRQLDEDPEDISEFDDLFRVYANQGYQIAVDEYVKPKEWREMRSDDTGSIYLDSDVRRVSLLQEKTSGKEHRNFLFALSPDGAKLETGMPDKEFIGMCEVATRDMDQESDEPTRLPAQAHAALADYICYRHLSNGNMAKQSKAQFYQTQFYQAMQRLRPQGMGSVRGFTNLYAATDIRRGW